ncbi:MAG TPA: LptA/OstA family protein [Armatimonadota bacterium]|nr:LptA/OstA family protein [Armatimonadota bacterium]
MTGRKLLVFAWMAALVGATAWAAQTQKPERKVKAEGAVAEIDELNNTIAFSGGAKLTTNEGTVSSRELEARLAPGGAIETAEARGEVKVNLRYRGKDGVERIMEATADRVIYRAGERTVQLLGNVKGDLKEPTRGRTLHIGADEATLWIDESRLRLRPAEVIFAEVVEKEPPAAPAAK